MKGFKCFELTSDNKLKYQDSIFEVGKEYNTDISKFYFYDSVKKVFDNSGHSVFLITALSDIVTNEQKYFCDRIIIDYPLNGCVEGWYFKDGLLHREDGPAFESEEGSFWCKDGFLHREDGPACEFFNGNKRWYKNGFLHREDGPAIDDNDRKVWFNEGKYKEETIC